MLNKPDSTLKKLDHIISKLDHEVDQFTRKTRLMNNSGQTHTNQDYPLLSTPKSPHRQDSSEHQWTKSFDQFLRYGNADQTLLFSSSNTLEKKSLTGGSAPGSLLIPYDVQTRLGHLLGGQSFLRSLANQTSIQGDELELVIDDIGAMVGWVGETVDRDETNTPHLTKKIIPVHEIYAKPKASQRLLDDSTVDIQEWILNHVAHQMAVSENEAFLRGNGRDKPTGILHYDLTPASMPKINHINTLYTGNPGIITCADILVEATMTLPSKYLAGAVWLVSRSALAQLRLLKDVSTGRYLWQPALAQDAPSTLFGFNVIINDAMDCLDKERANTPILFGNFYMGYQIVDRQGIQVLRDPYSAKPYVEFYTTKRVGGDVIDTNAFVAIRCGQLPE